MVDGKLHVGIGFATGRRSFRNVLRSYIFHLKESELLASDHIALSLFVAFDPTYMQTVRGDYELIDDAVKKNFYLCRLIGPEDILKKKATLIQKGVIEESETMHCFGNGYAAQRNVIVYQAMLDKVDYLLFMDDDEYPMAVTQSNDCALWSGQHVIENHVKYLQFSDITNGYHCGYVSPLPSIEFDAIADESVFRKFIQALSSDVLQWDSVMQIMQNGGVTYADKDILMHKNAVLVEEEGGAKFITGGNLGINLKNKDKVLPFYNPPGARGEDSFLSTCLTHHTVKRIPTYTFHDGFSIYGTLLNGVLPTNLRNVTFYDSQTVIQRFYNACVGWMRYKPLYTFLTSGSDYRGRMDEARQQLEFSIPHICAYFNNYDFENILHELETYDKAVESHVVDFENTKVTWNKIKQYIKEEGL